MVPVSPSIPDVLQLVVALFSFARTLSIDSAAMLSPALHVPLDVWVGQDILADTQLAWLLPAFEARLRAKERQHPKLYWVDPGVVRAARGELHSPSAAERGPLFEGWVATLLRAYGDPITGLGHRYDGLAYWAPSTGGLDVDFVVRRGRRLAAIEVKAKQALSSRDFSGLKAIGELKDVRRRVLVFLGDRPYRTEDGVDVLPVGDFIDEVEAGRI